MVRKISQIISRNATYILFQRQSYLSYLRWYINTFYLLSFWYISPEGGLINKKHLAYTSERE